MIDIAFIISAFVAGLLTFLAPCTLPLVPAYLGFVSGVDPEQLDQGDERERRHMRWIIIKNGLFFIMGFSIVFIIFGILFGFIGQLLGDVRVILTRLGGAFIIFFGLYMLNVVKMPSFLNSEKKFTLPKSLHRGTPGASLAIGAAFGFGWTPCVGPILAAILVLAGSTGTVLQGAFLLLVFSLGLGLPFFLTALAASAATKYISALSRYIKWISIIGGIFLVILGILLLLDRFTLLLEYGFQFMDWIGLDGLEDLIFNSEI
jgi:cytochrome c-type biogenesis protein